VQPTLPMAGVPSDGLAVELLEKEKKEERRIKYYYTFMNEKIRLAIKGGNQITQTGCSDRSLKTRVLISSNVIVIGRE